MILRRNWFVVCLAVVLAGGATAVLAITRMGGAPLPGLRYVISQRNQQFNPDSLNIHVGDTITIVNDDGDLRHHAYVSSPQFQFDSGDQAPGSRTNVVFTVPGRFKVLCGIHPKMRLIVTASQPTK